MANTKKKRTAEDQQPMLFRDTDLIDVGSSKLSLNIADAQQMHDAYQAGRSLGMAGTERCGKVWNETLSNHNGAHKSHYQYPDTRHIYDEFNRGYVDGWRERADNKKDVTAKPPQLGKYAALTRYRNPATGDTWSGRGQQPKWVREELANGATLSQFDVAPQAKAPTSSIHSAFADQDQQLDVPSHAV
jgi:hypothetical protein